MKQLHVTDRDEWRDWLSRHHATEAEIWLVFNKKETGKQAIEAGMDIEAPDDYGFGDRLIGLVKKGEVPVKLIDCVRGVGRGSEVTGRP